MGGYRSHVRQPTIVPHVHDAIDVATGSFHVCAVRRGGDVTCWGDGHSIGVGDGFAATDPPVTIPGLHDVVEIASRVDHTCARRSDGHVLCFGKNDDAQLGAAGAGVIEVPHLGDAVQLATTRSRSCARRANGHVYCWGQATSGSQSPGEPLPEVDDAVSITMDGQLCAVRANGAAICEFGFGDRDPAGGHATMTRDAVSMVSGGGFGCVVARDGSVSCVGSNYSGELGDGSRKSRTTLAPVSGLAHVKQVVASSSHACALLEDTSVRCWGADHAGQLGNGFDEIVREPVALAGVPAGAKLAVGAGQTCALVDTALKCWGNDFTVTRRLESLGEPAVSLVGSALRGVPALVDVAIGSMHSCGVTTTGGVSCWGDLLALGASFPYKPDNTPHTIAGASDIKEVVVGDHHNCARRRDGHVVCWGHDREGELGRGAKGASVAAMEIKGLDGVTALAAGSAHTCAIRTTGEVTCWGSNNSGQTGHFDVNAEALPTPTPLVIPKLKARAIAGGMYHSCAVTTDGHVKCWGAGFMATDLGPFYSHRSCTPAEDCPAHRFYTVEGISDAIAISAGTMETCVVRNGGTVSCWATAGGSRHELESIAVKNATAIAVSGGHTCAQTRDGARCWGHNKRGEVGVEVSDRSTPVSPRWPSP